MTFNVKNGPSRALASVLGVDGNGKGGTMPLASVNGGAVVPAGAVGDYAASTGASVGASSTAFSNSGGVTFTGADVGKTIIIPGAGAGGGSLTTTLSAVNGASATLAAAASAAVPASYISAASVATAQSGGGGSYVPGDTINLAGGTSAIAGVLTVASTKVVAATIQAAGSGGSFNGNANGTGTVYGTTGTGKRFQANVTLTSGAITAVNSISLAGSYTVNPSNIAIEPIVGGAGVGLTGAALALTMGVNSASASTPGNYSVAPSNPVSQASTSGSGTGATFNLTFTTSGAWSYATDDTSAIAAAASPMMLPKGKNYFTTTGVASLNQMSSGFGAVLDNAQRAQAPNFVSQTSAPTSTVSPTFIASAFTGDISRLPNPQAKIISGAATLGQPSSGYQFYTECGINFSYIQNNGSGWNQSTSGNDGRTGFTGNYTKVDQNGQGDGFGYFANVFVNGARAGATSFLANPAGAILGGQINAGQSGVYMQGVGDINLTDNGYDVAAISYTTNLNRTVDIGALGAVWYGWRSQSIGTVPIDAHISLSGKSKIGIDLTALTTNSGGTWTNAAITMLGNDRIYFNASAGASPLYASSPGTTYLYYSTGNTGIQAVVANSAAFLFTSSSAFLYGTVSMGVSNNNRIQAAGAANGSSPVLSVTGASDADVDFTLSPKGAGLLKVGTSGSMSANGSVATALSSIGPTGSHTTVQEWLTIKNSSGTTRYIPCF